MSNTRVLIWHFYKPVLFFNMVISVVCLVNLYKIGFWFLGQTFFIKLVGYGATILYKHYFSFKTNIYYLNAGHSIKTMYGYAFGLDFILYLLMAACYYLVKYAFA